jgi:hypothetical protein
MLGEGGSKSRALTHHDAKGRPFSLARIAKCAEQKAAHRGGFFMPADRHDGRALRPIEAAIAQ